ncbi:MAG: carboxylesterase/lipase family protein [Acidimicrobiales bacterium]
MTDPVVATRYGRVRGRHEDGVEVFRGVRYARAPEGELRWRPPAEPEVAEKVVGAGEVGPIAPQPAAGPGSYFPGDPVAQGEDCLSLNVWTPGCDDGRRPVMVFVHGGAFLTGSGSGVMYRGDHLARRGVVVVTFNYRVGVLGFLAHPLLTDAGSRGCGNWGLADQIAALRWVRDNVGAFGGDPSNVTVFGESAGSMSIADLLGAPLARGLFRRAILESGATTVLAVDVASAVADRFAALVGVAEPSRQALLGVPVAELVAAQREISNAVDRGMGMPFRPVVDGGVLPRDPADEIAAGAAAGVDLLVGTNRDEFKFFAFAGAMEEVRTDSGVRELVSYYLAGAGLGEHAPSAAQVLGAYRTARSARGEPVDPFELLCAVAGDWIFRVPSTRLAEAHARRSSATYMYLFDWESPFAGGALGACHGVELPFVFGSVRHPVVAIFAGGDDQALALSDLVQGSWVAFARSGDPSTPEAGHWPRYDAVRRATMVLGRHTHVEDAPYEPERSFWQERLGRYGSGGPMEGAVAPGVALLAEGGGGTSHSSARGT